jgi:hypothetical protein
MSRSAAAADHDNKPSRPFGTFGLSSGTL